MNGCVQNWFGLDCGLFCNETGSEKFNSNGLGSFNIFNVSFLVCLDAFCSESAIYFSILCERDYFFFLCVK